MALACASQAGSALAHGADRGAAASGAASTVAQTGAGPLQCRRVYVFDDSRRPLVVLHMSGTVRVDEIARFKADVDALVDRGEAHAVVWDLAGLEIPAREVVMDTLRWTRALRVRYRGLYEDRPDPIPTYTAYHVPGRAGALLRFFEGMLPWLANHKGYFASFDEALAAAEQALRGFALEVPPPIELRRLG